MKILGIETSCDETAAAVIEGVRVLSSVKITQEVHAEFGGVVPSLAKRDHEANIDWVIDKAISDAGVTWEEIDAIAVTMGPGLAIALGVGIAKAKELATKHNKKLIAVNHVEGHVISSLLQEDGKVRYPCLALVVSGGHTQLILVNEIGSYEVLLESLDDDIGEALDKGARLIGLPYPGGQALEKMALLGEQVYKLPLPMAGKEGHAFSYAGLKAAFFRLVKSLGDPISEKQRADLAATYQEMVFKHLLRTIKLKIEELEFPISDLLVGGGVAANKTLRNKLDSLAVDAGISVHYPNETVWCTDNAAMIALVGLFKAEKGYFDTLEKVDRRARWRVDQPV